MAFISKALQKDMNAAKKNKPAKYIIKVDGFKEETAKTIKRANTLRTEWIRFYKRNNKVSKQEAEKAVVIEDV